MKYGIVNTVLKHVVVRETNRIYLIYLMLA